MRRTMLVLSALLVTTTFGCERVKPQFATLKGVWTSVILGVNAQVSALMARFGRKPPPPVVIHHHVVPTPPPPPPAPTASVHHAAAGVPGAPATPGRVLHDVPYVSQDTGTLTAGMSERDVYSLWGAPIAVRRAGEYTYLFFRNGCEYRCGMEDVVTLDNGQVVNAVVRWPGHNFLGGPPTPSAPPAPLLVPTAPGVTDSVPVKATVPSAPTTTNSDSVHAPG
jgi:hypothetical protein